MRQLGVLALFVFSAFLSSDELAIPQKLSIHTWVREDIFAGFLAEDVGRLELGVKKLDAFLKQNPDNTKALAWRYGTLVFRMRQAAKANDMASYKSFRAIAADLRPRALSNPADAGAMIVVGGSEILQTCFLPEQDREMFYKQGREVLMKVPKLQEAFFRTLPPHMRGELWSQIALASDRLGDKEERDKTIALMLENLKGTPYEKRAQKWQTQSEIKSQADHTCISCHEPGRLEPTLARLKAGAQ
jgi:hypothetical protein